MATSSAGDSLVVIDFATLGDSDCDISAEIEAAFGPAGLGVIAVRNVPEYEEARAQLLPLAEKLEQLPTEAKRKLEDPESSFSFGWSFGKEALQDGKKDIFKGSFYANPIVDAPTTSQELMKRYPAYCRPNLWPKDDLPSLEPAFKRLGKIVVDVGLSLVEHCDKYVAGIVRQHDKDYNGVRILASLQRSQAHKARLLLYMPQQVASGEANSHDKEPSGTSMLAEKEGQLWCEWHLDHGSFTGLARAEYRKSGVEVPCPDPRSGLYIRKRNKEEIQVAIPEDCIAFQMGQAMSIMSGGLLCATPHCVKAPKPGFCVGLSRSTFAVFMQPMWDEPLIPPPMLSPSSETLATWGSWQDGVNFGEFSEKTIGAYYGKT